jgi:hypothetical protein
MPRIRESLRIAAGLGLLLATGHGFESVARAGGFAGMNGLIGGGAPVGQMGMPYTGTYAAGDYSSAMASFPQGFGNGGFPAAGNGFDGMDGGFAGSDPFVPGQQEVSQADENPSPRATTPRSKSARQKAVRKPARRPATTKTTRR